MAKGALLNALTALALCVQCSAQGPPAAPTPAPAPPKAPAAPAKPPPGSPNSHTTHKKQHGDRHHELNVPHAPLVMNGRPETELAFIMGTIGTVPYGHHVPYHLTEPKSIRTSGCGDLTNMFTKGPDNTLTLLLLDGDRDDCSMVRRAYNAGRAGAAGVLISRGKAEKSSKLEARVDAAVDDLPSIEGIQIPVGTMINDQAKMLREEFRKQTKAGTKHMVVHVDFRGLLPKTARPAVWIWHDAADDCGSLCDANVEFLKQIAATQVKHGAKSNIAVRPRFIFQPCKDKGNAQQCAKTCTPNGKYCHLKDIYVSEQGQAVAMEQIREACLWDVLTEQGAKDSSPAWWQYKHTFLHDCTSAAGTYNQACSEKVAAKVAKGPQLDAWKQCFAPMTDAAGTIGVADAEIAAMDTAKEPWYSKLMVQINEKHYLGLFDTGHVYHAACVAMTSHKGDPICASEAHGPCAPGSKADMLCRNSKAHLTTCKKLPGDDKQGVCKCGPGWKHKGKNDPSKSDTECTDDNECTHKTDPCRGQKGNAEQERRVCHNLVGGSECLTIPASCEKVNDFGGCWREFTGEVIITSCEDNIAAVREAAGKDKPVAANELPPYSYCDCSQVPGCFKGKGTGTAVPCVKACEDEECEQEDELSPGTCSAEGNKRTAGIVGGVVAALVIALAALVALVIRRRRARAKDHADLRKQASAYAAWQDGLSGDEMQASGTVAGSEAAGARSEGAFRAASAAAYVSTTGEEVLPDA